MGKALALLHVLFLWEFVMRRASVSYLPELVTLENRWQPGTLLMTSIESSLIAGGIAPLDIQDPDAITSGVISQSAVNQAETAVLAPPAPAQPASHGDLATSLQDPVVLQLPQIDPAQASAIHALQLLPGQHGAKSVAGINVGHGPGTQGSACENPGNVVVNGDFEAGPPDYLSPWSTMDSATGVAGPGAPLGDHGPGDLTPTYHLVLGNPGSAGSVNQTVATDVGQVYNVIFSMKLDPIDSRPVVFQIRWNGAVVADLSSTAPSDSYNRYGADGSITVTGSGSDFLEISARQDPNFWHVDDFCVTPAV
jgi:hypothetical protein